MQKRNLRAGRILWFGCAVIVIGVVFHALLTAWFASRFGYFDLVRLWKEFILGLLAIGCGYLVVRHPALRRDLQQNLIVQLIVIFIGFIVLMTAAGLVAGTVGWRAAGYGLMIDTRFFIFLLVIMVAAYLSPLPLTRNRWILFPALVVIAFGLLQLFVLPSDFLRHFGYGVNTLPAFQPVDNKPDIARVQSTLRGPNPLGAYLVVVIMGFMALATGKKRRLPALGAAAGGLIVLYGSYSRSAVAGLVLALWLFGLWSFNMPRQRRIFIGLSLALVVISSGLTIGLRHNDTFQNIVFHTNEKSTSPASSNNARFSALRSGFKDIINNPLGSGVGSAGPASLRNHARPARIAENFFVQIGQEAGIIGLTLFIVIIGVVGRALWRKRSDVLVRSALASLCGVILINMVSHAWADDTLAYVFFAFISYALVKTSTKSENLAKL